MLPAFSVVTAHGRKDDYSEDVMTITNPRIRSAFIAGFVTITMAACGGHDSSSNLPAANTATTPVTTTTAADTTVGPHHSKLAGAAVGAVAGHMLGGHAVAGAAVGALVQHERNKHRR